jgi:hypothetical protein
MHDFSYSRDEAGGRGSPTMLVLLILASALFAVVQIGI